MADLETPVSAFLKLVGQEGSGFLLESVENGDTWGRFSFVGRDPALVLVARDGRIDVEGRLPEGVPLDRGVLAALEGLLAVYRSPVLAGLPPLHGGVVGFLGYDVVREVERLPAPPPDDLGMPDAVLSVIGHVAAFDHWRQRVWLIENVVVGEGAGPAELDLAYDLAASRLDASVADLAGPLAYRPAPPPDADDPLPEVRSTVGPRAYCDAVEVVKDHILAGDVFQVVLSQRFDLDLAADPFDVYRVLRQVNPSPYMYFLRHPAVTVVGSSPEPMVQLWCPGPSPAPAAGVGRPRRTAAWPASWSSTPRRWPSTSCWSIWPATTWAGW